MKAVRFIACPGSKTAAGAEQKRSTVDIHACVRVRLRLVLLLLHHLSSTIVCNTIVSSSPGSSCIFRQHLSRVAVTEIQHLDYYWCRFLPSLPAVVVAEPRQVGNSKKNLEKKLPFFQDDACRCGRADLCSPLRRRSHQTGVSGMSVG